MAPKHKCTYVWGKHSCDKADTGHDIHTCYVDKQICSQYDGKHALVRHLVGLIWTEWLPDYSGHYLDD